MEVQNDKVAISTSPEEDELEQFQKEFLENLKLAYKQSPQKNQGIEDEDGEKELSTNDFSLPDHVLCIIAEYLDHNTALLNLSMVSRYFYISMQLRYKSLCIKHSLILTMQEEGKEDDRKKEDEKSSNFKVFKEKSIDQRLVDSKNYMSIFGKFMSKGQLKICLNLLKLDPLNPDNIIAQPRKFSQNQDQQQDQIESSQSVYNFEHKDDRIKQVFTNSLLFTLFLKKDKQAYITKAQDNSNPQDQLEIIPIPYVGIDQVYTNQNQFIFTTKGLDGKTSLYHGHIEEKEDDLVQLIPESGVKQKKDVKIKSIMGPIQFGDFDLSNIKLISATSLNSPCIMVAEQPANKEGQSHFIYTWSIENDQFTWQDIKVIPNEIDQISRKQGPVQVFPKFTQIKCTQNQIALLSDLGNVHQILLGKNQVGECRIIKKLTDTIKIDSCFTHFIALQKKVIPPIKEWSSQQVAQFISKCGFAECANIAIYQKVTGDQIAEWDEDLWVDTFGIPGVNELQKIRFEIGQSQDEQLISQGLFGWGSNTFGQLGVSNISVSQNVPHPISLPVPQEIDEKKDQLVDIACGKRHSFFITSKGQIWATGNLKEEKNSRLNQIKNLGADNEEQKFDIIDPVEAKNRKLSMGNEVEESQEKHSYKKKGGKNQSKNSNKIPKNEIKRQRAKDREENKMINDQELSVKHRWMNLCEKRGESTVVPNRYVVESIDAIDTCQSTLHLNVSRKFKAIGSKYKETYFVPEEDESSEQNKSKKNKWGTKFTDVYKLMAWLCYEQNIYKNEDGTTKNYTVCYVDRFIGIIETEVWRFHQEMDIPSHRVRMIKCDGEVVWDRTKKFSSI